MKEKIYVEVDGREFCVVVDKENAEALKNAKVISMTGESADVEEVQLFAQHWSGNAKIPQGVKVTEGLRRKTSEAKTFELTTKNKSKKTVEAQSEQAEEAQV